MAIKDNNSPAAYLVFDLTFPFMKDDLSCDELNPTINNQLDMYRCAEITMNILKQEFANQGVKHPEYYDIAREYIVEKILHLKQSKNK
jgi:hypothetical protein